MKRSAKICIALFIIFHSHVGCDNNMGDEIVLTNEISNGIGQLVYKYNEAETKLSYRLMNDTLTVMTPRTEMYSNDWYQIAVLTDGNSFLNKSLEEISHPRGVFEAKSTQLDSGIFLIEFNLYNVNGSIEPYEFPKAVARRFLIFSKHSGVQYYHSLGKEIFDARWPW